MKITWVGHACFLVEVNGVKVLHDPYDSSVGYKVIPIEADIVCISHSHGDHSNISMVKGKPVIISSPGERSVKGLKIKGIQTFHDPRQGALRGKNIVFKVETQTLNWVHLGDLGHVLDSATVEELTPVDILMIPVGGTYTIDASEADMVVSQLNPKIVIPMHYKTPVVVYPISRVADFITGKERVVKLNTPHYEVSELPSEQTVIVFQPMAL